MRGTFIDRFDLQDVDEWEILRKSFHLSLIAYNLNIMLFSSITFIVMQIFDPKIYHIIYWSGNITTNRLRIDSFSNDLKAEPLEFHSVLVQNSQWNRLFCCTKDNVYLVSEYEYFFSEDKQCFSWKHVQDLDCYDNYEKEALLQLKLDQHDRILIGTSGKGFIVWDFNEENRIGDGAVYLPLPHGVRNISTKIISSNSMMISSKLDYSVAGVRYRN